MKPATVDAYLEAVPDAQRPSLERLRAIIRDELPEAEETLKYGIPTFKLGGYVVSFAAFKGHCSLFPGHTVKEFAQELAGFKVANGTIQFREGKELPEDLVRRIVRSRAGENLGLDA